MKKAKGRWTKLLLSSIFFFAKLLLSSISNKRGELCHNMLSGIKNPLPSYTFKHDWLKLMIYGRKFKKIFT